MLQINKDTTDSQIKLLKNKDATDSQIKLLKKMPQIHRLIIFL